MRVAAISSQAPAVSGTAISIDNLISADVVTADGEFREASATEHPDLFWSPTSHRSRVTNIARQCGLPWRNRT
jgi:hypothetical protein